jgi:hypothetical protein
MQLREQHFSALLYLAERKWMTGERQACKAVFLSIYDIKDEEKALYCLINR